MTSIERKVLYDVKPVTDSGKVDVQKIEGIEPEINLRKAAIDKNLVKNYTNPGQTIHKLTATPRQYSPNSNQKFRQVFNQELQKKHNLKAIFSEVGAVWHQGEPVKNTFRRRTVGRLLHNEVLEPSVVGREINWWLKKAPPNLSLDIASPEVEPILEVSSQSSDEQNLSEVKTVQSHPRLNLGDGWKRLKNFLRHRFHWTFLFLVAFSAVWLLGRAIDQGKKLEQSVFKNGTEAADSLQAAKNDLAKLDFTAAANHFNLAYDNFSQASARLNLLGASLTSFLGKVPGLEKMKAAQNMIKAGENASQAGESVTTALGDLYHTNFVSNFDLGTVSHFREALNLAEKKLTTAQELLANVSEAVIPEDKRAEFINLKSQLPLMKEFLSKGADYSDFLLEALGQSKPKKYLLLFQNNTELRPTGGFPGSYALVSFNQGRLGEWQVDDVYNIDSQAKKQIIPPLELRHITPTWGMRDANWFVNFPDSARKIMQMYTENDGGPTVDGVITLTPTVIVKILGVIGPVPLLEYNLVLDQKNFLAEIQEEVEYGPNRVQPKKVLVDFAPLFLAKLGQQDKEHWFAIVKILLEAVEQKHILAYFKDLKLQAAAVDNDFAGVIKKNEGDYLMITHTNVKGSKTDAVIDNQYKLQTALNNQDKIEHTLTITRAHRGGKNSYAFYNRQSYDYLRVLVPLGSHLLEIKGQTKASFGSLVNYQNSATYVADKDLEKYESGASQPAAGVKQFSEAGRMVFGFWLFLSPGESKSVALKYETPLSAESGEYLLLAQKQPGTGEDKFDFSATVPEGKQVIFQQPQLQAQGRIFSGQTKLSKDLIFGMKWQ